MPIMMYISTVCFWSAWMQLMLEGCGGISDETGV